MSAYVYAKDYSDKLKDIVIGDYTISMGQGLIANNAFGSGKSAWVTDVKRGGRVIRPYNSVSENAFFRGGALTLKPVDHIECTLFGSYVRKDGNSFIDTSDVENISNGFSSLLTSGNHRTEAEIEDEGAIRQFSA